MERHEFIVKEMAGRLDGAISAGMGIRALLDTPEISEGLTFGWDAEGVLDSIIERHSEDLAHLNTLNLSDRCDLHKARVRVDALEEMVQGMLGDLLWRDGEPEGSMAFDVRPDQMIGERQALVARWRADDKGNVHEDVLTRTKDVLAACGFLEARVMTSANPLRARHLLQRGLEVADEWIDAVREVKRTEMLEAARADLQWVMDHAGVMRGVARPEDAERFKAEASSLLAEDADPEQVLSMGWKVRATLYNDLGRRLEAMAPNIERQFKRFPFDGWPDSLKRWEAGMADRLRALASDVPDSEREGVEALFAYLSEEVARQQPVGALGRHSDLLLHAISVVDAAVDGMEVELVDRRLSAAQGEEDHAPGG